MSMVVEDQRACVDAHVSAGVFFRDEADLEVGPFAVDSFAKRYADGTVSEETPVFCQHAHDWVQLGSLGCPFHEILTGNDPRCSRTFVAPDVRRRLEAAGVPREEVPSFARDGGRIVRFRFTLSFLFFSFLRRSDEVVVKPGESLARKALPYNLLTLLLGWWAFPFGPVAAMHSLLMNWTGAEDQTAIHFGVQSEAEVSRGEAFCASHLWLLATVLAVALPAALFGLLSVLL